MKKTIFELLLIITYITITNSLQSQIDGVVYFDDILQLQLSGGFDNGVFTGDSLSVYCGFNYIDNNTSCDPVDESSAILYLYKGDSLVTNFGELCTALPFHIINWNVPDLPSGSDYRFYFHCDWRPASSCCSTTYSVFSSYFSIGITPVVLSFKIIDFKISKVDSKKNRVQLDWLVEEEFHGVKYIIERSRNGHIFHVVGELIGEKLNQYTYWDQLEPWQRLDNFYRLKMIDIDGAINYSDIIQSKDTSHKFVFEIYPNPSSTHISISGYDAAQVKLEIYNSLGVRIPDLLIKNGQANISALKKGFYYLCFSDLNSRDFFMKTILKL